MAVERRREYGYRKVNKLYNEGARFERLVLFSEYDLYMSVKGILRTGAVFNKVKINGIELTTNDIGSCLRLKWDDDRGVKLIPVPDDDKDHNPDAK